MEAVWLLPPNWANEVRVTEAWRTSILATPLGNEQRSALFAWPRLTHDFTPLANSYAKSAWITRALHAHLASVWQVPVWTDGTRLTAQADAGQAVLPVATTGNRRFIAGGGCILINPSDWSEYALGAIDSLDGTSITLDANLADTWPDAEVYPLFSGILSTSQKINCLTARYRQMDVSFAEFMTAAPAAAPSYSPTLEQYLGEDLFLLRPNWIDTPVLTAANAYRQLAYLGVGAIDSLANETGFTIQARWTGLTRPAAWEIRAFFMYFRGRHGRFWMPTWQQDVRVTAAIAATDTTITIEDIDYETSWLTNNVTGRHLYIQFPDGSWVCRAVLGAAGNVLSLDAAVGTAVDADGLPLMMVSFLLFWRFAQDEIEGVYASMDVVDYQLACMSIPDEAPGIV